MYPYSTTTTVPITWTNTSTASTYQMYGTISTVNGIRIAPGAFREYLSKLDEKEQEEEELIAGSEELDEYLDEFAIKAS